MTSMSSRRCQSLRRTRCCPPPAPRRTPLAERAVPGGCIPGAVHCRLQLRGKDGGPVGNGIGHRDGGCGWNGEQALMRVEAEDKLADPLGRPIFHPPDHRVAVFYWKRELPFLEGAAHPSPFALRHQPAEDQRLRAAAEPTIDRPHQQRVRVGRSDLHWAKLRRAWAGDPECLRREGSWRLIRHRLSITRGFPAPLAQRT